MTINYNAILIIIIILYIYLIQFKFYEYEEVFLDDLILKTGDIILFKAYNNFNAIFIGSYYTHIGIIIMINNIPMLFEANGIEKLPLLPHHNKNGIFMTPAKERIAKYKGKCYLKRLKNSLSPLQENNMKKFTDFAIKNMYYNYNVFFSSFKKLINVEKCNYGTNCGELVFLSLIVAGIIDKKKYDECIWHHLRYVCNITNTDYNEYLPLIDIIDHPFKY